jgi:hypothetical protein
MNIFVTSDCPNACAKALDDVRVNKMILETAQLLCTAHHLHGTATFDMYKPTHANHPCAVWVRQSQDNYCWTFQHFNALLREFEFRRSKHHACRVLWRTLKNPPHTLNAVEQTPFANCSLFKDLPVHDAYRATMLHKWANDKIKVSFTHRGCPEWAEEVIYG